MLLKIHPENPQKRHLDTVIECLKNGGIIIYPTDTIYGIGCDIYNKKAVERICRIKGLDPKKANLSFICEDLSHLSTFARNLSNPTFRILKAALPGPYTFILPASKETPKIIQSKKDTVGLRVPDHIISQEIVRKLGNPLMSTSLPMQDEEHVSYYTDPEIIYDLFHKQVDIIIDSGIGNMTPSTVVDCTQDEPQLIRQGQGEWPIL
ncbi:MAG TPA: L-threonylcarbamoyladenylate synthase [Chitinophagaceae bacterium]|nr:L-threonylcarbamoyladenylate synthase [Chitinophagaceae bacterium]